MKIYLTLILLLPLALFAQKDASIKFNFPPNVYDSCSFFPDNYKTCDNGLKWKPMISNTSTLNLGEFNDPFVLKLNYGKYNKLIFIEPGDSINILLINDSLDLLEFSGRGAKRNQFLTEFNKKFFTDSTNNILQGLMQIIGIDSFEKHNYEIKEKQYEFYAGYDTSEFSRNFNDYIMESIEYNYLSSLFSFLIFPSNKISAPANYHHIDVTIADRIKYQGPNDDALINQHYRAYINNYILYFASTSVEFDKAETKMKFETANALLNGKTLVWYIADLLNCNYKEMTPDAIILALDELDSIDLDSNYIPDIRAKFEKYILNKPTEIKKNKYGTLREVELKDINGKIFNVENLKGKVVYVDFWASWCGPCRQEFPAAKALHKRFTKKQLRNIVFLYISIDANETAWKKVTTEVDSQGKNLLVSNGKYAFFQTDIDVSTIPRYLLINKNGKIVNYDAPRPSSNEIIYDEIVKLLEE